MNSSMTELDKDEQFYRDTESIAFPRLDDRQLAMLEPLGTRRIVRRGELVYKAGQRDLGLTMVLRGELEVFESRDGQEQILATLGPRGFIGDVAMLMGTAALANARGKADESEILEVLADRLRQALAELPGVSEPIVRAFIMRRQRLKRDREFAGLRILAQDGSRVTQLVEPRDLIGVTRVAPLRLDRYGVVLRLQRACGHRDVRLVFPETLSSPVQAVVQVQTPLAHARTCRRRRRRSRT